MQILIKYFSVPILVTFVSLILIAIFGNVGMLFSVLVLIILEITLSFDNAVVNAKVLEDMSEKWRKRFINWGIWVAVFGTRVILPIIIVAIVSGISFVNVVNLALFDSITYGMKLDEAHYSIGAFGGIFLVLVALKFFIDEQKDVDWIGSIERKLKKFSSIESIEVTFALIFLLIVSYLVPTHAIEILVAGIVGAISFILIEGLTSGMGHGMNKIAKSGFALFMYLNVLDVAFSLDGVIGAFAISSNLIVIALGLGIGAYFVRSFTLYLVDNKTLGQLKYLEHGAHWAILGLGICMLLSLLMHIPEFVTGTIGICFVLASYLSSAKLKA
jgi:hypothetical protein